MKSFTASSQHNLPQLLPSSVEVLSFDSNCSNCCYHHPHVYPPPSYISFFFFPSNCNNEVAQLEMISSSFFPSPRPLSPKYCDGRSKLRRHRLSRRTEKGAKRGKSQVMVRHSSHTFSYFSSFICSSYFFYVPMVSKSRHYTGYVNIQGSKSQFIAVKTHPLLLI